MPCGIFIDNGEEYILEYGEGWAGPRIIKRNKYSSEVYFNYDNYLEDEQLVVFPKERGYNWIPLILFSTIILIGYMINHMRMKRQEFKRKFNELQIGLDEKPL